MELNLQDVIAIYKDELSKLKEETIIRRVIQKQLEQQIEELNKRIVELEKGPQESDK